MIAKKIERFRRALWTWRQPLTRKPAVSNLPISDLFVWRSSVEWQTHFELIDIPSLFEDFKGANHAVFVFFDYSGRKILEKHVELKAHCRQTLNISSIVGNSHGEIGTFAVFHARVPPMLLEIGSFLAERGYVSYCYRDAPMRSYVHGNLDAVSLSADAKLEMLGCAGWRRRSYNLQHELHAGVLYEIVLVNPTPRAKLFILQKISLHSASIMSTEEFKLASGAIRLLPIQSEQSEPMRLVIQSRVVMARPLVFRIKDFKLDVFHG